MAAKVETFCNGYYELVNEDRFVRTASAPAGKPSMHEEEDLIHEIETYVEAKIKSTYGFISIPIPNEEATPTTSILASPDWQTASKLLLIIQNSAGSLLGIFSRSICIEQGLSKGSMLLYIHHALAAEYGVIILRPNTNSVLVQSETPSEGIVKVPIQGSESPEIHTLCVWENVVSKAEASHIALLGYANGAHLCKDLYLKETVRSDAGEVVNRIKALISIEASYIIENDDPVDIQLALGKIAVNLECHSSPKGFLLAYRREKLGCTSISLGMPQGVEEVVNVGVSISIALLPVFKYLQIAEAGGDVQRAFIDIMASDNHHDPRIAVVKTSSTDELMPLPPRSTSPMRSAHPPAATSSAASGPSKLLKRISQYIGARTTEADRDDSNDDLNAKLTVQDFDLMKIVGKGAFGKVMLVRKKKGPHGGKIFAMKVLKKSMIVEKNQVEHAKSERDILFEIRHPFIVRLRFAFQSEDKLYLVTDYYNGGTLFYHLRKSMCFTESRTRFYAAELLLALDHLHSQKIIYRDLKLENVLLDHLGHVALTDFGLSKQNFDKTGGATTFCGTPDYVAPELLRGQKYGKAVDWWSFGVLIFEMIHGQTPFFDKNRKTMFQRIVSNDVTIPSSFSSEAGNCIRGLLTRNPSLRLGSSGNGALDIMATPFFTPIDFVALMNKKISPTFKPDVNNEFDTKYVPKFFLETKAVDSVVASKGHGKAVDENPKFDEFTFSGDSGMTLDK